MKLLLLHAFLTFYMTGVLWLVQRVQYPLLLGLDEHSFKKWLALHSRRSTPVVGFAMLAELLTAGLLLFENTLPIGLRLSIFLLTLLTGGLTVLVSIPIHNRLAANGYDRAQIERLIRTNWPRTFAASAKAMLLALVLLI